MAFRSVLAVGSLLFLSVVSGQLGAGSNSLYLDSVSQDGVGRPGSGFYVPQNCSYVVDYYAQCGGSGTACDPATGVCEDAQYPGACCPTGFTCRRENPQYWQCVPAAPIYSSVASIPLAAYAQCGGTLPIGSNLTVNDLGQFVGTECPVGYSCIQRSPSSSICEPNPMAAADSTYQSPFLDIIELIGAATGANALSPGLQQYNFDLPGSDDEPSKPVSVILNTTLIGELLDKLLDKSNPPPAGPEILPPAPGPAPPSIFNFTVPQIVFQPLSPLSISGTDIVNASGSVVSLRGFNWFGFETGDTILQGLTPNFATPRNISQTGDFGTVVYRQQALGFNTVRLPFRFGDLNLPAKEITRGCIVNTAAEIKGNLSNPTAPYNQIDYASTPFPAQRSPATNNVAATEVCNGDLPGNSTLDRFLYVIQYYIGNGFYVIIDYHAGLGQIESDRQIVAQESIFRQNWQALLIALQSLPTYQTNIKGRIFFDLLNEPDAFNMTWSSPNINTNGLFLNSSVVPSWGSLYTNTAAALAAQEPALLFLAEGAGQYNQPGTAYGMGFGIDPEIYTNARGLYNALIGLQQVVSNDVVKARTIISPHCYGGQISGWIEGFTDDSGLGLPYTYFNNWAYLNRVGVPPANGIGPNATFPILVGEFGNVFNSSLNATTDDFSDMMTDQWIHDFAQFNNQLDPVNASAYTRDNIVNTIWWAWNGNQAQALGLVNADPGNVQENYTGPLSPGWLNIQWVKINNLTDVLTGNSFYTSAEATASGGGFGLRPWYL